MTPCAASRTQTCARTFSKDFTVRSSGVSLRVFHRRTRWCKPSQQHAHTRKPSARPSRDRAAGVSTALHCTHTRAHILHTHAHPFAEQDSSRSLVAARGASAIPSFWPASACSPGPSTLRRNCRSHGRMRVKEWLDSCGALSTNMQRAEIDHVECRSHSDLLYNARGLKCATLAHALSLSQCLHKSSSDMSRAAAAVRPSLLTISAKRNPKRPLHGALCDALTPERPSRVHCRKERRTENSENFGICYDGFLPS